MGLESGAGGMSGRTGGGPWWSCGWWLGFGFLLVVLHLVHDPSVLDETLLPRLQALLVFVVVPVAALALVPAGRRVDLTVLREPIVVCWAALFVVTCGSLLVAVNATAGLTDVFRTLGSLLVLCLGCLLLPTVPRWQERFVMLMVVGAIVSAACGWWDFFTLLGPGLHGRLAMQAVLGQQSNVNLYAGYLNLLLPWCLCGAFVLASFWRFAAVAAALAVGTLLVLLQSRAAYVGLAAGVAATLLAACRWREPLGLSRRVRSRIVAAFLGGALGMIAMASIGDVTTPIWGRIRSIVSGEAILPGRLADGGRTRIWRLTSRLIADHPFVGVGAGNFTIRIHEYYGAEDADLEQLHSDNWLQPHNDFLWVWSEKGLVGLAAFLGILWCGWRSIRTILATPGAGPSRPLALAALWAITANTAGSCFDFPLERISHQVCLAAQFAVVTVLARDLRQPSQRFSPAAGISGLPLFTRAVGLAVLGALAAGIVYTSAGIRQERFVILARRATRDRDWQATVDHARRAATPWKTLDPLATPISFLEGMALMKLGRFDEATSCLERARRENPNRMYVVNNLGILYAMGGRHRDAAACLGEAVARYPDRIDCRVNLAGCLVALGRTEEAIAILEAIPESRRTDAVRANLRQARGAQAATLSGGSRRPVPGTGAGTLPGKSSKE